MNEQSPGAAATDRAVAAALAGSAVASAAVSADGVADGADDTTASAILAWRWVLGTQALDLYAAEESSPHWRATCVGAGGALHRARVALAAEGMAARVTLLPDTADRERTPHLARLVVARTIEVTDEARALFEATEPGHGAAGHPAIPGRGLVRELIGAARSEGVRLRLLRDRGELIGLLHGADTREAWLRAGMAASAIRLLGRRHGLTTVTALVAEHRRISPGRRRPGLTGAGLPAQPARTGWRRIGDREGWLSVGVGTPYLRLRLVPVRGLPGQPQQRQNGWPAGSA